jgi:hypothetical protein
LADAVAQERLNAAGNKTAQWECLVIQKDVLIAQLQSRPRQHKAIS